MRTQHIPCASPVLQGYRTARKGHPEASAAISMINEHPHESIPAFVLGVLDPEEASAIAQHLSACASCRADAAHFRDSIVAAQHEAPEWSRTHVKQRIMDRVAADKQPPIATIKRTPAPRRRVTTIAAAGAAMLALLLAVVFMSSLNDPATIARSSDRMLREREIALVQGQVAGDQRLVALLAAPGTVAHDLAPGEPAPTAHAALYIHTGDPRVGVLIRDLPPAPVGQTYQLWVANEGGQVSLGVFTARADGTTELLATAPAPVDTYTDFMVTVEPNGGAAAPGSVIVWQVKL